MKQLTTTLAVLVCGAATPLAAQSDRAKLTLGKPTWPTGQSRLLAKALKRSAGLPRSVALERDGATIARGSHLPLVGLGVRDLTFSSTAAAQRYVADLMKAPRVSRLAEARGRRVLELIGSALDEPSAAPDLRERAWKALGVAPTEAGALGYHSKGNGKALWTNRDPLALEAFRRHQRDGERRAARLAEQVKELRRTVKRLEVDLSDAERDAREGRPALREEDDDAEVHLADALNVVKQRLATLLRQGRHRTADGGTRVRLGRFVTERHGDDVRSILGDSPAFRRALAEMLPPLPTKRPAPRTQPDPVREIKPERGSGIKPDRGREIEQDKKKGAAGRLGDLDQSARLKGELD